MNEAYLKGCLCKVLRAELPGSVVFRHEDQFTAGIPDLSVTWLRHTTWIEVKFDRPGRPAKTSPAQAQMIERLPALLVRYRLLRDGTKTIHFEGPMLQGWTEGFAHWRVAEIIQEWHKLEVK